jgi:hypothetical protein
MRLTALLGAALLALAAGCGGKSKPLAEKARPCLAKLGTYIHHVPRPIRPTNTVAPLPVIDPDFKPSLARTTQSLAWSDEVEEYGEISYRASGRGANAVQILIFKHDDLPKRVVAADRRFRQRRQQTFFFTNVRPTRDDRTLLLWSSTPTPGQKRAVYSCLNA